MTSVTTLLDRAREAIDVIQHALSQLGRCDLAEDQVAALDGISDDLRALGNFARVCAAIGRLDHDQPDRSVTERLHAVRGILAKACVRRV